MTQMKRRRFLQAMWAVGAGAWLHSRPVRAASDRVRVLVVGNGIGGRAFVQAMIGLAPAAKLSVIDPRPDPTTALLAAQIADRVQDVDFDNRRVVTATGRMVDYDLLVFSPGATARWDRIEGYTPSATRHMPHGWLGTDKGSALIPYLSALPARATVVMYVPAGAIRYPQAVDLRAEALSRFLERRRPGSKLLVLDASGSRAAWLPSAANVEWLSLDTDGDIVRINPGLNALYSRSDTYRGDLVNLIPPQQAGGVAMRLGLADSSGWCPVDADSCESRLVKGVFVLGDANNANPANKSGETAVVQAKDCAEYLSHIL